MCLLLCNQIRTESKTLCRIKLKQNNRIRSNHDVCVENVKAAGSCGYDLLFSFSCFPFDEFDLFMRSVRSFRFSTYSFVDCVVVWEFLLNCSALSVYASLFQLVIKFSSGIARCDCVRARVRSFGREVWLTCNARHVLVVDPFISMRGYETTHSLYQFFTTKQHKTKEMERNKNEWRWWKKISSIIHYKFEWEWCLMFENTTI